AEQMDLPSGLVTFVVGDTSRATGQRSRSSRSAKGAGRPEATAESGPKSGPEEWTFRWSADGPGPLLTSHSGEPDLTLALTPGDAELVRAGQLGPSVAFMQGRLKTAGDNALLLRVLAWTTTPAFADALDAWSKQQAH
ncbi:MAG TPA: SCP2 sterol-binding domain-containing protein, partial [Acidimicrobiales bacterium]|nr:SCP2 sterol-binding domain-containing protein [Acidimicrobiales bacterium]